MKKTRSGKGDPALFSRGGGGLKRVVWFDGKLLSAADLADEQSYFQTRLRRRNRFLHGAGVVSGLKVAIAPAAGAGNQSVVVEPGFAIDPRGEEIEVCQTTALALPPRGRSLFVQLKFVECPTDPVPSIGSLGSTSGDERIYSRIEETFTVVLTVTARLDAVSIARLARRRGRWRMDRRFRPPRAS